MPIGQTPVFSLWDLLAGAWPHLRPVFLILLLILAVRITLTILTTRRLARADLPEIDRMDGRDFEAKLALLFRQKGYQVETTPYVGDWGADLIIANNGRRAVVQAKRWKKQVSPRAVQEAVAAKAKYGCQDAMVVTNSYFTPGAKELARVNHVELWDRERLARELSSVASSSNALNLQGTTLAARSAPVVSGARDLNAVSVSLQPRPKCYKCGREMILRENTRGKFWACSGFPQCRNTFPARS